MCIRDSCNLRELCLPVGLHAQDLTRLDGLVAKRRSVPRGEHLFRNGERFEALYAVPPMYHMNLDEYGKHRKRMLSHYGFVSPILRELGMVALTDFAWLTADRLVQQTVFGDAGEIVANFGHDPYHHGGLLVPARGVVARVRGKTTTYVP